MMINAINGSNNVNMCGRIRYSKHTPKPLPFDEFYFQPELRNKPFSLKRLFKSMANSIEGLFTNNKSVKEGHFEDIKSIKCSTTEI